MSVELDPVELGFRRPFDREVEEKLRLHNPNSDPVAFKVKTTAPKQYCVRPNSGRIEAGQNVEVSVLLQAMKEDPPLDAKCRDKFLVQSVAVAADQEFSSVQTIWSNIESVSKSSIQEKKIRVNFLPADGSLNTPARQTTANHSEAPPAYSSPSSPQQYSAATPTSKTDSKTADSRGMGDTASAAVGAAAGATAAGVGAAVGSSGSSGNDAKAQLAEAQAQISKLTQQLKDQGLRQRKSEAVTSERSSSNPASMAMQQAPAGVPVQIVAVLCLLSFLIAYMLF